MATVSKDFIVKNGIITKQQRYFIQGQQPEGFVLGRG